METPLAELEQSKLLSSGQATLQARVSKISPEKILPLRNILPIQCSNHLLEIARLVVQGWNKRDIATELKLSYQMVLKVTHSPLFQAKVDELGHMADERAARITAKLKMYAEDAVEVMAEVMTNEAEESKVRLVAAKEVLDRAGFKGKESSTNIIVNIKQEADKIQSAEQAIQMINFAVSGA